MRQGEFLTLKEALIGKWAEYESETRPITKKPTPLRIVGVDEAVRFGQVARKARRHGAGRRESGLAGIKATRKVTGRQEAAVMETGA